MAETARNVVRRRAVLFRFIVGFAVCGCAASQPVKVESPPTALVPVHPSLALTCPVVVLDPGHGGEDPGARYHDMEEKTLTLDIARRVKPILENAGARVQMTRDSDAFIPLSDRIRLANKRTADAFVSIHVNANRRAWVSGLEVYAPRESEVTLSAEWPPEVRANEIAYSAQTVRQILWDVFLRRARLRSYDLSAAVCSQLQSELTTECTDKTARFVVLREAWVPAVLVEVGYLSNAAEAEKISNEAYRERLAQAIGSGIISYLAKRSAVSEPPTQSQ